MKEIVPNFLAATKTEMLENCVDWNRIKEDCECFSAAEISDTYFAYVFAFEIRFASRNDRFP